MSKAASYNEVRQDYWEDTVEWPLDERVVAIYLLTSRYRNTEGLFRLRIEQVVLDLDQLGADRVRQAVTSLEQRGWLVQERGWMLLVNGLRWARNKSENNAIGAARVVEAVPRDSHVWAMFCDAAARYWPALRTRLDDPLGTPSEGGPKGVVTPSRRGGSSTHLSSPPTQLSSARLSATAGERASAVAAEAATQRRAAMMPAIREALTAAGYDRLVVEQSDGAIVAVLHELQPPTDVDWFRVGQEVRRLREAGTLRRDRPDSALKFVGKGANGFPRINQPGGTGVQCGGVIEKTRAQAQRLAEREPGRAA
jgi:hypothetical protein